MLFGGKDARYSCCSSFLNAPCALLMGQLRLVILGKAEVLRSGFPPLYSCDHRSSFVGQTSGVNINAEDRRQSDATAPANFAGSADRTEVKAQEEAMTAVVQLAEVHQSLAVSFALYTENVNFKKFNYLYLSLSHCEQLSNCPICKSNGLINLS